MIRFMERAVEYVQHMPKKAIKHCIKVYALCCATSGVMLKWKVYTGSLETTLNTTVGTCDVLAQQADLTEAKGQVLDTNKNKLQWHLFGTLWITMDVVLLVLSIYLIKILCEQGFPILKAIKKCPWRVSCGAMKL